MLRYYWRLKKTWPTITGYQKNDLEASNDSSYYYGYFDDLTHWELANGKVQNYFYDLHDQLVKAEFFKKDGTKETWVYSKNILSNITKKCFHPCCWEILVPQELLHYLNQEYLWKIYNQTL